MTATNEERRRQALAEEFQRALTDYPEDFPWGLTADRVYNLRPTRDDIELWLLVTRHPGIPNRAALTRGQKGHFTRRLDRIWSAVAKGYQTLDLEGRPGYYDIWVTGKLGWNDPTDLGAIWARDMRHASQVARLMFDHVSGPDRYTGSGRGEVRVRFLGGTIGEGEEFARNRQADAAGCMEKFLVEQRKHADFTADRVQLLEARLAAILAVDLTPGPNSPH